jgi:hypothetical protein
MQNTERLIHYDSPVTYVPSCSQIFIVAFLQNRIKLQPKFSKAGGGVPLPSVTPPLYASSAEIKVLVRLILVGRNQITYPKQHLNPSYGKRASFLACFRRLFRLSHAGKQLMLN